MGNFNTIELTKLVLLATTEDPQEKQRLIKEITALSEEESGDCWERLLKFTDKEISKMPKYFKSRFRTQGLWANIRKRKRGNSINYEVRCRNHGYNISASGTTQEEAKERFIEKLHLIDSGIEQYNVPTTFQGFAMYYFENYRKRKVKARTYRGDLCRLNKHIIPHFSTIPLKSIIAKQCQDLIDRLDHKGMSKTADEVFSLLNCIFKYAIAHGIILRNPLATVFHQTHERKHGRALTKQEEAILLSQTTGNERLCFAIALYSGLRPNEYYTIQRNGDILTAINSKRKNNKVEYKRIPINPMLAPIIQDTQEFKFPSQQTLWKKIKIILPGTTLYNLRTTFYTRCKECGVADAARDEMVGHSLGALGNTYTDLSNDYLIQEANKIHYDLPPILPPNKII